MDGQQRPIEFFRQDLNTPVSVGILVDTSGSMTPKIPQARAAIAEFLRDLNDKDDVFLFAFSSHPFLLQPFTINHDLVMRRLALLHAYGQTALFDVIMEGLQMVQRGRYDKKALLVVTDGMDNTSASTVNDVVAQARRMGVLVYSIGIGDPNGGSGGVSVSIGPFVLGGDDSEHVDAETLHTLSTETGAKTYIIREAGDGEALRRACENISLELREQYTIGFLAPDPSAGGYRSLRVDVPGKSGADVRVRKGVDVGAAARADRSVVGRRRTLIAFSPGRRFSATGFFRCKRRRRTRDPDPATGSGISFRRNRRSAGNPRTPRCPRGSAGSARVRAA